MEENKNVQEVQKQDTGNNNGKNAVVILVMIILILLVSLVYVLFLYKPSTNNNTNTNNNQTTDNTNVEDKDNKTEQEEKKYSLDIYKNGNNQLCEAKDDVYCTKKALSIKTKTIDARVLTLDTYSKYYILYNDDGLNLYDIKKGTSQKINMSNEYEQYEIIMNKASDKIIGITTKDKNNYNVYYSISAGKELYKNRFNSYELYDVDDDYIGAVNYQSSVPTYLLNANKEEVKISIDNDGSYCTFMKIANSSQYVYAYTCGADYGDIEKLYNKELKVFYEVGKDTYVHEEDVTVTNNNVYINEASEQNNVVKNIIKQYSITGNFVGTKNNYTNVMFLNNGYIVYVKDDNLTLENLDNSNEIKTIVKWNEKWYIDVYTSGYYTSGALDKIDEENKKEGLYIVIDYSEKDSKGYYGMEYCYTTDKQIIEYPIKEAMGGRAKPVLYLYPENETNVTVTFAHPEYLTTTYPKYLKSWNVVAKPNGDLTDKDGKHYYALYWDEVRYNEVDFGEGFYVEGKDAIKFLEEKLTIIGLSDKERNEFIMYWLPIMENNKKNLVYFELTNEREAGNKLIITPKPDSLLRVSIHIKKVTNKVNIKEQKLTSFNRNGFVAVEWGGMTY